MAKRSVKVPLFAQQVFFWDVCRSSLRVEFRVSRCCRMGTHIRSHSPLGSVASVPTPLRASTSQSSLSALAPNPLPSHFLSSVLCFFVTWASVLPDQLRTPSTSFDVACDRLVRVPQHLPMLADVVVLVSGTCLNLSRALMFLAAPSSRHKATPSGSRQSS